MVRKIWRETGLIKAGKNFKVTDPRFSNVIALNGFAKLYCIIISADNLCYHLHFPSKKLILYRRVTPTVHNAHA